MSQGHIVYRIGSTLYINLTNRCTCRCQFCPLGTEDPLYIKSFDLKLDQEPTANEIVHACEQYLIKYPNPEEIVFCGYGEPTLRLKEVVEIASALKSKGFYLRLNTNGHGNLIHKRNIVFDLEGLIDEIRISLNAESQNSYQALTRSCFKKNSYKAVKDFVLLCKKVIPKVIVSAVSIPGLNLDLIKEVSKHELGVSLMIRELNQQGIPQKVI